MNKKALYFVTKEKKVKHIGFLTDSYEMRFFQSKEHLVQYGYQEDTDFFRENNDSIYIFSSFLPKHIMDSWFDQIVSERSQLKKIELKIGKTGKTRKNGKVESPLPARKKTSNRLIRNPVRRNNRNLRKEPRILNHSRKQENPRSLKMTVPRRKKTPDIIKEEVEAQRRWTTCAPTCGQCVFWEKRSLRYTQTEAGECVVTGNFVNPKKRACSEFQKR
jgi:hypothetical protein